MDRKAVKSIYKVVEDSHHLDGSDRPLEVSVMVKAQPKRIKLPANMMIFQKFAFIAATTLKPATCKIFMLFMAQSGYENYIGMDVLSISEVLAITTRSVITGLKELEENNIIIKTKHPSDKRRNDYFVNPYAAWKGNSYARMNAISKIDKNQLLLFPNDSLAVKGKKGSIK
jgi:predicted transcriptional regulator